MASFDLVDTALDGGLAERLKAMREEGLTLDAISRRFDDEGFKVSRETVRRWLLVLP